MTVGEGVPGSVWLRPPRPPRAVRGQAFTQDDLAVTAVALADADGLEALSMRRVSAELGITAMSLYWYVDTKEQLVELMVDRVFTEQRLTTGADWRSRLRSIGQDTLRLHRAHPWFVHALGRPGTLPGPGQLRHWDDHVRALTDPAITPRLAGEDVTLAVGTIKNFVSGYALSPSPGVLTPYVGHPEIDRYLRDTVLSQSLDHLRSLAGLRNQFTEDRFDSGLELVLDGLETHLFGR
ncbi:TetR/AcrR family transcriptional regulator [Actinoplanes bogorensis]|uniref:TetR/AcrR family transcriptional regulator n=1 Tax=Paractinoplanes bogorensis TaxID=1610840 RepID=A0ABS5YUX3_9ACTN|nr:TetR/AcrR family transcriptional regulator [Actinoplanes bogorensis]MBU2667256.1 TetR/AcrR family transcriptional regulator [Actinoplanes bogorensis]